MKRKLINVCIRLFIVAVLGGAAVYAHRHLSTLSETLKPTLASQYIDIENSRLRQAFLLEDDNWLTFRLPSTVERIKVLSYANLPLTDEPVKPEDPQFDFILEYQLEDGENNVVKEGQFVLLTKRIAYADDSGAIFLAATYKYEELMPAAARISLISLLDTPKAKVLKLRPTAMNPEIVDICVRVGLREKVPPRKLPYLWERLAPADKELLARPRFTGSKGVTRREERNLVQQRWKPLGPAGIAGKQYQSRDMYLRHDYDELVRMEEHVLVDYSVIRAGPGRHAMFPVEEDPEAEEEGALRMVRLKFSKDDVDDQMAEGKIRLLHYPSGVKNPTPYEHELTRESASFRKKLSPGVIEVISPVPVQIVGEIDEIPVEVDPLMSRAWRFSSDLPVEFPIKGAGEQPSFFKGTFRPLTPGEPTKVTCRLLDGDGNEIESFDEIIPSDPSPYDSLCTWIGEAPIAAPVERFFKLNPEVEALEFSGPVPVLISAYTRPNGMAHLTNVPADYRVGGATSRAPVWFSLRPLQAALLERHHYAHLIKVQNPPPEPEDISITQGIYHYEEFIPQELTFSQKIFATRTTNRKTREEALPSVFMDVPANESVPFPVRQLSGIRQVNRKIAFFRDSNRPLKVRVLVDGVVRARPTLVSARGQFRLADVPNNAKTIKIVHRSSEDVSFFVNYVDPNQCKRIMRQVHAIGSKPLTFHYPKKKAEEMVLNGKFFTPEGSTEPAEIQVSITNKNLSNNYDKGDYTLLNRIFLINPDNSVKLPIMGQKDGYVDRGRSFYIPLGTDLDPGDYEVSIQIKNDAKGYLSLATIEGGVYDRAGFFRVTDP